MLLIQDMMQKEPILLQKKMDKSETSYLFNIFWFPCPTRGMFSCKSSSAKFTKPVASTGSGRLDLVLDETETEVLSGLRCVYELECKCLPFLNSISN